jgi:hypothetical protein
MKWIFLCVIAISIVLVCSEQDPEVKVVVDYLGSCETNLEKEIRERQEFALKIQNRIAVLQAMNAQDWKWNGYFHALCEWGCKVADMPTIGEVQQNPPPNITVESSGSGSQSRGSASGSLGTASGLPVGSGSGTIGSTGSASGSQSGSQSTVGNNLVDPGTIQPKTLGTLVGATQRSNAATRSGMIHTVVFGVIMFVLIV